MRFVKGFLLLLIFIWHNNANAQQAIATIKIEKQKVERIQSFYSGDTLFAAYVGGRDFAKDTSGLFYITEKGASKNSYFNKSQVPFCGFENSQGKLYHYYLENKKIGLALKAFSSDSLTLPVALNDEIIILEDIIGLSNCNGLLICSRNEKRNTIKFCRIKEFKKISEDEFVLPERFSYVTNNDFRLIGSTTGWLNEANTRTKIYPKNDQFILTLDHQSATEILFFNLLEKNVKSLTIPEPTDPTCNSFIVDSTLYRLSIFEKGLSIKTYSIVDGAFKTRFTYDLEQAKAETTDRSDFLSNSKRLKILLKASKFNGMPIIIVNKTSNKIFDITVGCQPKEQGARFYPASGTNPVGLILTNVFLNAINKLESTKEGPPSITNELTGRLSEGMVKFTDQGSLYNQIGKFLKDRTELRYLGVTVRNMNEAYLITENGTLNTLEVFRFSN